MTFVSLQGNTQDGSIVSNFFVNNTGFSSIFTVNNDWKINYNVFLNPTVQPTIFIASSFDIHTIYDFRYNYWDSTDENFICTNIQDFLADPLLAYAQYWPVLLSPSNLTYLSTNRTPLISNCTIHPFSVSYAVTLDPSICPIYNLPASLVIDIGGSLTILPGTVIQFGSSSAILVRGLFVAR